MGAWVPRNETVQNGGRKTPEIAAPGGAGTKRRYWEHIVTVTCLAHVLGRRRGLPSFGFHLAAQRHHAQHIDHAVIVAILTGRDGLLEQRLQEGVVLAVGACSGG